MRELWVLAVAVALLTTVSAAAHDLGGVTSREEAVVVTLAFGDGTCLSYENYEVYRPGEDIPFQVGRTDGSGRVVFVPDRAGTWRVRAFSADGHGIDMTVEIDEGGVPARADGRVPSRRAGLVAGVGIVFGVFGVISLLSRRRKR